MHSLINQISPIQLKPHLKDTLLYFEDGDVKSSSAEIVDSDDFVISLVETVCQRRGRGFVDDSKHVQTGDLT